MHDFTGIVPSALLISFLYPFEHEREKKIRLPSVFCPLCREVLNGRPEVTKQQQITFILGGLKTESSRTSIRIKLRKKKEGTGLSKGTGKDGITVIYKIYLYLWCLFLMADFFKALSYTIAQKKHPKNPTHKIFLWGAHWIPTIVCVFPVIHSLPSTMALCDMNHSEATTNLPLLLYSYAQSQQV